MPISVALAAVGALVLLASLFGVVMRRTQGRKRAAGAQWVSNADLPKELHETGTTLVQFSTEMCSRCPQVRRMLTQIVDSRNDVSHIEVDVSHRPDLARRYSVLSTPTTFVVDPGGAVRARFTGVPQADALDLALANS